MSETTSLLPAPGFRGMTSTNPALHIGRAYMESDPHQWVRELIVNSIQAGARRVDFTTDWQGVQNIGVYRRLVVDDGCGMSASQLESFYGAYGGSGRPVGETHDNFGVGAKSSLLPWNKYGMVLVSRRDGDESLVWLRYDDRTDTFGMRLFPTDEGLEAAVEPFDATNTELSVDFRALLPAWVEGSGTAVLLLGADPLENTVLGDAVSGRDQESEKGVIDYIHRRFWDFPDGFTVTFCELPHDRDAWPRSTTNDGTDPSVLRHHEVKGAHRHIVEATGNSSLVDSGTVTLSNEVNVHWFLSGKRRPNSAPPMHTNGFITVLYQSDNGAPPEMWDFTQSPYRYRRFGISEKEVRDRLFLVIEPPRFDPGKGKFGVYPNGARSQLLAAGSGFAGSKLPIPEWGEEFAASCPDAIVKALRSARDDETSSSSDYTWRNRLAEKFGERWPILRSVSDQTGKTTMLPTTEAIPFRSKKAPASPPTPDNGAGKKGSPAEGQQRTVGVGVITPTGRAPARNRHVGGGLPDAVWVDEAEFDPGFLANWIPHDPNHPSGLIQLNRDHPVILEVIRTWQGRFPPHHEDEVRRIVLEVYKEVAVAQVAHTEHLRKVVSDSKIIDEQLRSSGALTTGLLGIVPEEEMISSRLSRRLGAKRRV